MSNDLQLVLEQPIESLIPAMLAWNNAELKTAVSLKLSEYDQRAYGGDTIVEAKADRAALNGFSQALNNERLRIKKVYEQPYLKFKAEVDEVISLVDQTADAIDSVIKGHEASRAANRMRALKEYFAGAIGDLGELVPYEKIHNPKWLNATVGEAAAYAEIDKQIARIKNGLSAIEGLRPNGGETLKAFYFRSLDLPSALIEDASLRRETVSIAERTQTRENVPAQAPAAAAKTELEEEVLAVVFRASGTPAQLKLLKEFLQANKIYFENI